MSSDKTMLLPVDDSGRPIHVGDIVRDRYGKAHECVAVAPARPGAEQGIWYCRSDGMMVSRVGGKVIGVA